MADRAEDVHDDEVAIARVLVDYCAGIDRRDWERFERCFTADCNGDYGPIGSWSGSRALTAWMSDAHAAWGPTLHRLTNLQIDVEGDHATARSYVDAVLTSTDGQTGTQALGIYNDELRRGPGGWRIASRRFTMVLQRNLA